MEVAGAGVGFPTPIVTPTATPVQDAAGRDPFETIRSIGTIDTRWHTSTLLRGKAYGLRTGYDSVQSAVSALSNLSTGPRRGGVAVLAHDGRYYGFAVEEQVADHRVKDGVKIRNLDLETASSIKLLSAGEHPDLVALVDGATVIRTAFPGGPQASA